jgi:hypothetical protein
MPEFVVGFTELVWGKLKKCKGFSKPNFGRWLSRLAVGFATVVWLVQYAMREISV